MKLTDVELQILKLLQDGRKRYTEIAEKVKMSPGGLTKLLKRLQEKNLIRRIQESTSYPPPVYYELTEEGEKTLLIDECNKFIEDVIEKHPGEFSQGLEFISKLPKFTEEEKRRLRELIEKLKSL